MENKKKTLVSVVTVSYNAAAIIEQTMLSVINQTYENIEYIIIDGGSTDGTVDIIKKYANSIAYWVSEPDNGIYDAMNKGIKVATGEWINFMNAGDIYYNERSIKDMVQSFTSVDTIYYGDAWVNDIKKKYWGKFSNFKLAIGNICHQTLFYPSSILKENLYDTDYCIFADYALNLKLWKTYKYNYIPQIVCFYDFGGISTTKKDTDIKFKKNKRKMIKGTCGIRNYYTGRIYSFCLNLKKIIKH